MFSLFSSDTITYEYFLQDNICRLCWNPDANNPATDNEFMEKVLECLGINLFGSVLIPSKICATCFVNVENFHKFKICSYKADQKLRSIFEKHKQKSTVELKCKSELDFDDDFQKIIGSVNTVLKNEERDTDLNNEETVYSEELPKSNVEIVNLKSDDKKSKTHCNICHKDWKKREKYILHLADAHGILDDGSSILYQCFGCDKTFSERRARQIHEKSACEPLKDGYECRICKKLQPNRRTYEVHMKKHLLKNTTTLPDVLQFKCKYCVESFKSKQELNKHAAQHTVEKKHYVCETCGRVFTRRDYLHKHMLLHTGTKKHVCTYCGFRATQKSTLNVHIRKHTGERPFSCDICQQKCVSSSNLKAHRKRHLGVKDYQCALCEKKFGYKVSLEEHIAAIHERTQEFTCEHCGAIYTRKRGLKRHILRKHKTEENETKQIKGT